MERKIETNIERTHGLIEKSVPHSIQIDSLEVAKQVEEYRQFWKPDEINVVLLAESHVYTDEKDYKIKCNRSILHKIIPSYPLRFVRFVYCLGYGEDKLLMRVRADRKNAGTPQYWKIFSSCVAENENDLGFQRVLKTQTQSFIRRLHNKVSVLRKMRERGIWLLDASIVGLYGSGTKNRKITERIIEICWKNHVKDVILETDPKHIIVIGKGVGKVLRFKLRKLNIPFTIIPQSQARGSSSWQLENYKKYQRVCAGYAQ